MVFYGSEYWHKILNFEALVEFGTISPEDLNLFEFADDPATALRLLQEGLLKYHVQPEPETPAIARTVVSDKGEPR